MLTTISGIKEGSASFFLSTRCEYVCYLSLCVHICTYICVYMYISVNIFLCKYVCYLSICVHIWVTWDKFSRQGTVCLDWGAAQTPVNTSTNTRPTMGICILYLCTRVCTICYIHCICLDWERAQTRVSTSTNTQLTMLMQIQEHTHKCVLLQHALKEKNTFQNEEKKPSKHQAAKHGHGLVNNVASSLWTHW